LRNRNRSIKAYNPWIDPIENPEITVLLQAYNDGDDEDEDWKSEEDEDWMMRTRNLKMKTNLVEHNDDGYHPRNVPPSILDTSEKLFHLGVTF